MGKQQKTVLAVVIAIVLIGFFWLLWWLKPNMDQPVAWRPTTQPGGQASDGAGGSGGETLGAGLTGGGGEANGAKPTGGGSGAPVALGGGNASSTPKKSPAPRVKSDPSRLVVRGGAEYALFVMSLCLDRDGRLWVGAEDEGVFRGEAAKPFGQQWTHFTHAATGGADQPEGPALSAVAGNEPALGDDHGYALACDKLGRIWVGQLNHGVSVYDGRDPSQDAKGNLQGWRNYDVPLGPLGERVFAIKTCPVDGDVWIATSAGLARYSLTGDSWSHYTRADGLPADVAQALAFDAAGNIYVGTQCDGLLLATRDPDRGGTYKNWRQVKGTDSVPMMPTGTGLPSNLINDVLVAKDGTVFVATAAGLAWSKDAGATFGFIRGQEWRTKVEQAIKPLPAEAIAEAAKTIEPERLLLEDYVTALAQDARGNIWVGHRRQGYEILDNQNLNRLHSSAEDPHTPVDAYDYVTRIQPVGDGASCWVGWYSLGLTLTPDYAPAPAPAPGTTPTPILAVAAAETPASGVALPAPAKAPTLAELNALLANLGQKTNEPLEKQPSIVLLNDDWRTQGDWLGRYGRYWACLCGIDAPDYCWGAGDQSVSYGVRAGTHSLGRDGGMRFWVHWLYSDNRSVLEIPPVYMHSRVVKGLTTWDKNRRQAEWNDNSQEYPMTFEGPDLYCSVQVPPGLYYLSLYDFNKDGHEDRNRFRDYQISVRTGGNRAPSEGAEFDSLPELARSRIHDFWGGHWKRFLVRGPTSVQIKLHRNYSFCTIISGLMLDAVEEEPAPYFRTVEQARQLEEQAVAQQKKLLDDSADSPAWQKRFAPAASEPEAVGRLLVELDRLRVRNPAAWAADARRTYAVLARWQASPAAKAAGGDEKVQAAGLGSSLYHLQLFPAWEQTQKARGLTPAREIEKALRWDGVTNSVQGTEATVVGAYVREQRLNGVIGPAIADAGGPPMPGGTPTPGIPPAAPRTPGLRPPTAAPAPAGSVQRHFKLELKLDKPEYFLGENILVHYGLTNTNDQPLKVEWAVRCRVEASDEQGRLAAASTNRSGFGSQTITIPPGETFWTSLPLMQYCDFERAGTYRIRIYQDLGWEEPDPQGYRYMVPAMPQGPHVAPIGETTIKLLMPDAAQARKVVEETVALPNNPPPMRGNSGTGLPQRSPAYADFSTLHYPVYLPITVELAQTGNPRLVEAIAATALPEATKALIDLGRDSNLAIVMHALSVLNARLPDPDITRAPARPEDDPWRERRVLVQRAWRPEFAPLVRDLTWKLLEAPDRRSIDLGAQLAKSVGSPDDLPRLVQALDRVCAMVNADRAAANRGFISEFGVDYLLQTAGALIRRGAKVPEKPQSAGEALVFLTAIGQDYTYRPEGWEGVVTAMLSHAAAPVRAAALPCVPTPIPQAMLPQVATLLSDPSQTVSRRAWDLARRSPAPALGEAAAGLLATTNDFSTAQMAFDIAMASGSARDTLFLNCVDRLDDKRWGEMAFRFVIRLVQTERGWGAGGGHWSDTTGSELKGKWKAFLEANRQQVRDGKLFTIGQAPLTADLFPPDFHFTRADGSRWP